MNNEEKIRARAFHLHHFDVFKINVSFGIDTITQERKQIILDWYHDLLDLKDSAFEYDNIPEEIRNYEKLQKD